MELLPAKKPFGLRSQMTRAAVSLLQISQKVVAAAVRMISYHFLSHCMGSLAELETQLIIGIQIGYFLQEHCDPAHFITAISRGIVKLQQSLKT